MVRAGGGRQGCGRAEGAAAEAAAAAAAVALVTRPRERRDQGPSLESAGGRPREGKSHLEPARGLRRAGLGRRCFPGRSCPLPVAASGSPPHAPRPRLPPGFWKNGAGAELSVGERVGGGEGGPGPRAPRDVAAGRPGRSSGRGGGGERGPGDAAGGRRAGRVGALATPAGGGAPGGGGAAGTPGPPAGGARPPPSLGAPAAATHRPGCARPEEEPEAAAPSAGPGRPFPRILRPAPRGSRSRGAAPRRPRADASWGGSCYKWSWESGTLLASPSLP